MDDFERRVDARALEEIRTSMGFMALERILRRMREDAIETLASNPTASRKETKGKLLILDQIVASVDEEIAYVRGLAEAEQETLRISRGVAVEGGGTGDLT